MALVANLETLYGETRQLYVRINNVEASNHGQPAYILVRGFLSREAFEAGKHYVWEQQYEFQASVADPLWAQGYVHLKSLPEFAGAADA